MSGHFKYMGAILFTFCFDCETTTGDSILYDPKMFVLSYCQVYSSHPDLKLDEIVIYKSFQENVEEIYSLNQFSQEYVKFFDSVTLDQMKDAAANSLVCQKSTLLS